MQIVMLGMGYVGLVSSACFSEFGISVVCIDNQPDKIEALRNGRIPIRVFNSQGFYSLAASWKLIEEEIRHLQPKNTAQPKHGEAIKEVA